MILSWQNEENCVPTRPMEKNLSYRFPPSLRVKTRSEFKRLQSGSRKLHSTHFLVIVTPSNGDQSRIGITVTTKVDKRATQRNRIKRLVREFFRHIHHHLSGTFDIIVIARQNACDCSSDAIREELSELLKKHRYVSER